MDVDLLKKMPLIMKRLIIIDKLRHVDIQYIKINNQPNYIIANMMKGIL